MGRTNCHRRDQDVKLYGAFGVFVVLYGLIGWMVFDTLQDSYFALWDTCFMLSFLIPSFGIVGLIVYQVVALRRPSLLAFSAVFFGVIVCGFVFFVITMMELAV